MAQATSTLWTIPAHNPDLGGPVAPYSWEKLMSGQKRLLHTELEYLSTISSTSTDEAAHEKRTKTRCA